MTERKILKAGMPMKMHLGNLYHILEEALTTVNADVSLVMIELADGGRRDSYQGLPLALELAQQGESVLMVGWNTPANYAYNAHWHACMAMKSVDFTQLPFSLEELRAILLTTPCNNRPADPLALRLLDLSSETETIRLLKHDLSGFDQRSEDVQERFGRLAAELYGKKPLAELKELVEEADIKLPVSVLAGESYPDVFVDIEGTLNTVDGVNAELLEQLVELSIQRPITIWTGGDISLLEPPLRQYGIRYKIASKYTFAGAKVTTAFDDLPYERFQQLYGIEVEEYIQV